MPNLNAEQKLITPTQALMFILFGSAFACWYFDIDIIYHADRMGHTLSAVLGWVTGR